MKKKLLFFSFKLFLFFLITIFCFTQYFRYGSVINFEPKNSINDLCNSDSENVVCFFGRRFCHPGYSGEFCTEKLQPANPWYTSDCPNLKEKRTFDVNFPLNMLSSGENCPNENKIKNLSKCAYLCFSHEITGVAQIPLNLWKLVQQNEFEVWKNSFGSNDRGAEHIEGFGNYIKLPKYLGNYLEIGCGPYTQTQFIINHEFESITLLDPGAENYIKSTPGCTYKDGQLKGKKVNVYSFGAEKLDNYKAKFDTLLSINVVEHVWDAFKFFNNIYNALKPGGILIYHDRFYPNPGYGDRVLGILHFNSK